MRIFLPLVTVILLLPYSCKKDPKADPAFFIQCGKVQLLTDAGQGSGSHLITDLWLYVNGKFQGAYPTGHLLPIVSNGEKVRINVLPGIKNNGISGTRIFYPFYDILEFDTLAPSGQTLSRDFGFRYKPSTIMAWNENFEGTAGYSIEKSSVSWVNYRKAAPEDCFEGKSIYMKLSGDSLVGQLQSTGSFTLPTGRSEVYLEMNYRCNEDFVVALIGQNGEWKEALNIAAQDKWNKIYVQLSEAVSSEPVSKSYKVGIRIKKLGSLDPYVYLDNLRVLHF